MRPFLGLVLSLLNAFFCASVWAEEPPPTKNSASVILSLDGGGDFGPQTPATRTSGWQEALDFCVSHARDLYVAGGFGGRQAVYQIDDTIRFPAAQDFRVDGGVYVINYRGASPDADAVLIDSCMNCEYHLGVIVYGGKGAGLRIEPEKSVPIDGFPVVIESQIVSQGIADPGPSRRENGRVAAGLVIDASMAGVSYSKLYFASILNFNQCISVAGAKGFFSNEFVCEHLHTNAHESLLASIDETSNANHFRFGIGVDQDTGVRGINVSGFRNVFELSSRGGGFVRGKQLILEPSAEGNQINVLSSEDFLANVQDMARTPTNQLTWAGPPRAN